MKSERRTDAVVEVDVNVDAGRCGVACPCSGSGSGDDGGDKVCEEEVGRCEDEARGVEVMGY